MKLVLDDQPINLIENTDATLRQVIDRISDDLKQRQRVISEIVLDGRHIGGWDDPELSLMTVGQCNDLRLISEEPRNLAHKVLHEIASYMPRIKEALIETSSKIQSGSEQDGMILLEQITSTWAELYQGFQSAILVTGVDLNMVTVEGRTFLAVNEEIHKYLDDATVMVQENRMLELSDVLEYEIAPRMPLVEEGIFRIIKEMEKKPN